MKKIFKYTLCIGLAVTPIITTATVLASCTNKANIDYSNTLVAKYYNSFLKENHGRWAGNEYNFSGIKSDGTGLESNAKPLYDLSTKLEENVNNYGSYHAYLWLVNAITKMGYANLNKGFSDLKEATINNSNTNGEKNIQPDSSTTKLNDNIIYGNNNIDANMFYKTGLIHNHFYEINQHTIIEDVIL